MTNENDMLLARMEDLALKADKIGCAASKFLTPAQAQSVTAYFTRRNDVILNHDGGFDGAERTRAVFTNSIWGESDRAELLAALKIVYRPQDTLGHRDVLGALMALGIKREAIGDIIIDESFSAFVCLPEMSDYIIENLTKIGRIGIDISKIDLDELPSREEELTIKTDTVPSLRMDAFLSSAFGISRTKAAEFVASGRVSLNHQICLQTDKKIVESDLLSIRGLGRTKLLEVGGVSRKGRIFIKIGIYGR